MSTENITTAGIFSAQLKRLRNGRKKAVFCKELGLRPQNYQRYEDGRIPDAVILQGIANRCGVTMDWLLKGDAGSVTAGKPASSSVAGAAAVHETPSWEKHLVQVRAVPIYGYAQALSLRAHKGDLIPENTFELPTIVVPEDGHRYAAFRVEGESMAPKISDGAIALADPDRELTPRCVVIAKWDDVVTIKRYSREKDMIYLKSDNPAEGENYKVHAKDISWILRVVSVRIEV